MVPISPLTSPTTVVPVPDRCLAKVKSLAQGLTGSKPQSVIGQAAGGYVVATSAGILFFLSPLLTPVLSPLAKPCPTAVGFFEYDWRDRRYPLSVSLSEGSIKSVKLSFQGRTASITVIDRRGLILQTKLVSVPASVWREFKNDSSGIFLRYRSDTRDKTHTSLDQNLLPIEFIDVIYDGKKGPYLRVDSNATELDSSRLRQVVVPVWYPA